MRILRSTSHWGAFRAEMEGSRIARILPYEGDPEPSPLIGVFPEMLTSPMRVGMPVFRKGWLAGDKGAGRGDDDFVAVEWPEALDTVAAELTRVRGQHGNAAIFGGSYGWSSAGRVHHARTLLHRFLNTIGGFTGQVANYSYGAAMVFLPRVLGVRDAIGSALTGWDTIVEHCDVFLAFGGIAEKNWAVQSGGVGHHLFRRRMTEMRESRLQLINVSPNKGDLAEDVPAEWLPIRPNSDTALLLALCRLVIAADRHDRAFLAKYCAGFERFAAYLAGETDGVEKDAAWASKLTGISEEQIVSLADGLPGKRVMIAASWSLQRARHGEQPYWAIVALAAILGQIGLPGGGFAFGYGSSNGMGNPRYDAPLPGLPIGSAGDHLRIPVARVADLLLDPGGTCRFDGQTITYPDIKLIYWAGGNPFHHHQDLNRLRAAFRRPDTVIVHENYWTATARHADIVLPATTTLERNDIGGASRESVIMAMQQMSEPVGDARNDFDILADIAERMGVREAFTGGRTPDDWLRATWDDIRARFARRDIATPDFETFWESGLFAVPEPPRSYVMFESYRDDPAKTPLDTLSGRIELFSETVAAMNDAEQPGHPVWLDPEEWLGSDQAKRFPLHLLTPQPASRLHGQMDASKVSHADKRNGREQVRICAHDAVSRGIRHGDMVRVFNDRGACLASAAVTDAIIPGVVLMPTGATYDPDGQSDRNSNPNVLTRDIGTSNLGQGCAAQSCLVEIERFDAPLPDLRVYKPPHITARA